MVFHFEMTMKKNLHVLLENEKNEKKIFFSFLSKV